MTVARTPFTDPLSQPPPQTLNVVAVFHVPTALSLPRPPPTAIDLCRHDYPHQAKEKDFKLLCRDEGLDLANRTVTLSAVKRKDRGISPYEFFNGTLAPLKGSRMRDLDDDRYRGVVSMARDGNKLCVVQETPAKTKMVGMVNLAEGTINTVWDADVSTAPIVKRLSHNEVRTNRRPKIPKATPPPPSLSLSLSPPPLSLSLLFLPRCIA